MHSQLQWTFTTQVTMHNSLEELLLLEKGRNRDLNYGTVILSMLLLREQ